MTDLERFGARWNCGRCQVLMTRQQTATCMNRARRAKLRGEGEREQDTLCPDCFYVWKGENPPEKTVIISEATERMNRRRESPAFGMRHVLSSRMYVGKLRPEEEERLYEHFDRVLAGDDTYPATPNEIALHLGFGNTLVRKRWNKYREQSRALA